MSKGLLKIGASTGWLYSVGNYLLRQQLSVLSSANTNAIEFCLGTSLDPSDARVASLTEGMRLVARDNLKMFREQWEYRSLHLPDCQFTLDLARQVSLAEQIISSCNANTALIHPGKHNGEYPVEYYERLALLGLKNGFRLAVENMNKRKPNGFLLSELKRLVNVCGLSFVLDVQHAYEHDASMIYAWDLFSAMRDRVVHFHVSGESESSHHCLVHRARNRDAIMGFIGEVLSAIMSDESSGADAVIILEGEYKTGVELATEIKFMREEFNF